MAAKEIEPMLEPKWTLTNDHYLKDVILDTYVKMTQWSNFIYYWHKRNILVTFSSRTEIYNSNVILIANACNRYFH